MRVRHNCRNTMSYSQRETCRHGLCAQSKQQQSSTALGRWRQLHRQCCRILENEDLSGFEGVLIVAPFYNKPSQEGLYQHFVTVAKNSPVPVVLYNVPGRTGVNIEAATTLRIANECPNVVAIKEASGKIGQIEDIVENAPKGFEVLSGDDAITFELLTIGAKGVISVIGNAYPKEFGCMVHSAIQADYTTALKLHRSFSAAYKLLSADGNPAGIKSLLAVQKRLPTFYACPLYPHASKPTKLSKTSYANFKDKDI